MNEEILKRLDLLGAKLNVAGGAMWDAAQREVLVDRVWSAVGLICLAGGLLLIWMALSYDWKDEDKAGIAVGILCVVVVFGFVALLSAGLEPWLNPQYDALCNLLALVKRVQP